MGNKGSTIDMYSREWWNKNHGLERSFEPICPVADQLPADFSCCVVNKNTFMCPPGMTCTEKGCCSAEYPTVCTAHLEVDKTLLKRDIEDNNAGEDEEEEEEDAEYYDAEDDEEDDDKDDDSHENDGL